MEPTLEHTEAGRAVPQFGMAAIVIMATGLGWGGQQLRCRSERGAFGHVWPGGLLLAAPP